MHAEGFTLTGDGADAEVGGFGSGEVGFAGELATDGVSRAVLELGPFDGEGRVGFGVSFDVELGDGVHDFGGGDGNAAGHEVGELSFGGEAKAEVLGGESGAHHFLAEPDNPAPGAFGDGVPHGEAVVGTVHGRGGHVSVLL